MVDLDLVEFFSGKARITKLAMLYGFICRAFDKEYHPTRHPFTKKRGMRPRSAMDLNGALCFAWQTVSKFEVGFLFGNPI